MPTLPPTHHIVKPDASEQEAARASSRRRTDERRGTAHSRGYDSRWQKARRGFLAKHPLCVAHEANGLTEVARVVDHIVPHEGDRGLFWERDNWQGLCGDCHDRIKATLEQRWKLGEIDAHELRMDRELLEFFIEVT